VDNGVVKQSSDFARRAGIFFDPLGRCNASEGLRKLNAIFTTQTAKTLWITQKVPAPRDFSAEISEIYPQARLNAADRMHGADLRVATDCNRSYGLSTSFTDVARESHDFLGVEDAAA
jgi:hypothetical protein